MEKQESETSCVWFEHGTSECFTLLWELPGIYAGENSYAAAT